MECKLFLPPMLPWKLVDNGAVKCLYNVFNPLKDLIIFIFSTYQKNNDDFFRFRWRFFIIVTLSNITLESAEQYYVSPEKGNT